MRINLRVTYDGKQPKDVICNAKDLVAFEEKFSRSVAKFEDEFRLTDLLWLAWTSESRTNATKKEFNEWLDDVEAVTPSETDPK